MELTTVSQLPPQILQHFNRQLFTIYDRWELAVRAFKRYEREAKRKYLPGTKNYLNWQKLVKFYEVASGWKKAMDDWNKGKGKKGSKKPKFPINEYRELPLKFRKHIWPFNEEMGDI